MRSLVGMAYEVTLENDQARNVAIVEARIPQDEIPAFLGGVFGEVMQVVQAQGAHPAGPPFARFRVVDDAFEVAAGFPVEPAISDSGRVKPGELPAGDIAATLHRGSYEEICNAYDAVSQWVADNGRQLVGDPWESYLDGPEVAEPRTVVCFPLVPE